MLFTIYSTYNPVVGLRWALNQSHPYGVTHATHESLDDIYIEAEPEIYIYLIMIRIYIFGLPDIYIHRSLIDRYGRSACMPLLPCSVSGFGADKPRPVFVGCLWALGSIRSSCGDAQPSELLSFSPHPPPLLFERTRGSSDSVLGHYG